jgi:hypothetical protein
MIELSQAKADEERVMIEQMAAFHASALGGELSELVPDPSPFSSQEAQETGTFKERGATNNLLTDSVEHLALCT